MARKKHRLDEVLKSLSKKSDVRVTKSDIYVLSNQAKDKNHDLGNGSWGKISYLVRYHGYHLFSCLELPK